MTEHEYFENLKDLLDSKILQAPTGLADAYLLQEPGQRSFEISTRGLGSHKAIVLEKMTGGAWPCYKAVHRYAHKRCDSIVVTWDKSEDKPRYILIELKSKNAKTARQQLRTSLAFCHFVHRMVCAQGSPVISAKFASVTIKQFPVVLKGVSRPTLSWAQQPLQSDCKHMDVDRNMGCLSLASLAKMV